MPEKAGTAYIDVEPRLDGFQRELNRKVKPLSERIGGDLGRDIGRDMSKGLSQSIKQRDLKPLINSLSSVREQVKASGVEASRASAGHDRLQGSISRVNQRAMLLRNTFALLKWPTLIAGVGLATQAFSSLAGGGVALVSALAPLSGALVVLPSLFAAAAQGIATFKLATAGVGEAIKAAISEQTKGGSDGAAALNRQRQAAEQVRTAKIALTDSQRQAKFAQQELTLARKDATRQLEDMRMSVERGRLSEERARMSLGEARRELRRLESDPRATERQIADAELSVREARQGVREASADAGRARKDYDDVHKKGVSRMPQVVQAQRALGASQRAVAQASRAVASAQRDASASMQQGSAASNAYQQAMARLSAPAQQFVRFLLALKPRLDDLQATAAGGMFPGAQRGISALMKNFGPVKAIVAETAGVLGQLAEQAGRLFGGKAFGQDMQKIGHQNAVTLRRLGESGLHLASALRHVLVAARPFINWLTSGVLRIAKFIEAQAKAGRESGKLARFFDSTKTVMKLLWPILRDTAVALFNIGKAAAPLGRAILSALGGAAGGWRKWTESLRGKNALADYFQRAKGPLFETGRLVGALVKSFFRLGNQPGLASVIRKIRVELLPAVEKLIGNMTRAFGPHMVNLATSLAKTLSVLAGPTGALTMVADSLRMMSDALRFLLKSPLGGFVSNMLVVGGVWKSLKWVGAISAAKTLSGLWKGIAGSSALAAGAGSLPGGKLGAKLSKANPIPVWVMNPGGVPGGVGGKVPPVVPLAKPSLLMRAVPWLAGATALGVAGKKSYDVVKEGRTWDTSGGPMARGRRGVDTLARLPVPGASLVGKAGQKLGLGAAEGNKAKKQIADLRKEFGALSKAGDLAGLERFRARLNAIKTDKGRAELKRLGREVDKVRVVSGKPIRLNVNADPRKVGKDLRTIKGNFDFLRKTTFITMKDLLKTTGDNFTRIKRTMDVNSAGGRKAVTDNFRLGLRHIKDAMKHGEISASQGMQAIRRLLRQHSGGGKEAVKTNMFEVRKILAQTMDKGVSITDKGAGRIRRIFARELKAYGIKGREAEIYMDVKPGKGKPKNYGGGGLVPFGRQGDAGRDSIPVNFGGQQVAVGSGEMGAVLTRHQQADLNARTADVGGLPGFFKRNRRKHYMAQGGFVPMAGGGPLGTGSGFTPLSDFIQKRFGVSPSDGIRPPGTRTTTGGISDHGYGMAMDYSDGSSPTPGMDKTADWASRVLGSTKFSPGSVSGPPALKQLIYRSDIGGDHFDHVHLAMQRAYAFGASKVAKLIGSGGAHGSVDGGGEVAKIARQIVGGPDSPLKSIAQKVLDRTRSSAQKRLEQAAGQSDLGGFSGGGSNEANRALGKRMAARMGWDGAQWAALDELWGGRESSWSTTADNPTSTAYGIPQALTDLHAASLPKDYRTNAAAQIRWGLKYIKGKYGSPIAALRYHDANNSYARGGMLNAAKGLFGLGTFPSAAEIKKQESTVKKLTDKKPPKKEADQKRLAKDLNTAKQTLKSMKGRRGKGLKGRTKGTKRLNDAVEGYKLPESIAKGVLGAERHLEDLGAYYDQDEADYRVDEVLSQGELDALVAQKTHIRNLVGGDPMGAGGGNQLAVFRDSILPMVAQKIEGISGFIERLKARVSRNMKALNKRLREAERLRKLIKEKNSRIKTIQGKKKKSEGDKRQLATLTSQRDGLAQRLGIITQREIPALEADNMTVIGEKRPKSVSGGKAGENALLPDAREVLGATDEAGGPSLRGYAAEYAEKLRPGALQAEWKGHNIAIQALLREGATKPETTEDASKSQLTDLLKEQLQESQLRTAVSEAHFKVLRETPFGGVFHEGGVVPGPYGQERMILARSGETVTPAGDGGPDVRVILEDNRTRVLVDDREVRTIFHDETRRMARGVGRTPGLAGSVRG